MKERMFGLEGQGPADGIQGQFLFSSRDSLDSTETQPVLETSLCVVCRTVMSWLQKDSFLGAQSILNFYVLPMQGPDECGGFVYFVVVLVWVFLFGLVLFVHLFLLRFVLSVF